MKLLNIDLPLGKVPPELPGEIYEKTRRKDRSVSNSVGVYYTPRFIVEYVVEKLISPDRKLKIADISCGCGAFLLGAFRRLVGKEQDREKRFSVLREQIFGVDLDPRAVEICRCSLLLNALQDGVVPHENRNDSDDFFDFSENIKLGNSLLDSGLFGPEFFDCIVGNPPFCRERSSRDLFASVRNSPLGQKYHHAKMDYWFFFMHRGLELLKPGGKLAFIVNSYWTASTGAGELIRTLQEETHIEEIFHLGKTPIFENVSGQHLILILRKGRSDHSTTIKHLKKPEQNSFDRKNGETQKNFQSPEFLNENVRIFQKSKDRLFFHGKINLEPDTSRDLIDSLHRLSRLGEMGAIRQGIAENPAQINRRIQRKFGGKWTVGEGVFVLRAEELQSLELADHEKSVIRPYFDLCDVQRYRIPEIPSMYLIYSTRESIAEISLFPGIKAHLERFREIMDQRRETRIGRIPWWNLHWSREPSLWTSPKILSPQMVPRPCFAPAWGSVYVPFSINVFVPEASRREHLFYWTAWLNSRMMRHWFQYHAKKRGIGLEITGRLLAEAPVRAIDFTDHGEVAVHDRIVELVHRIRTIHPIPSNEKVISSLEKEIDLRMRSLKT